VATLSQLPPIAGCSIETVMAIKKIAIDKIFTQTSHVDGFDEIIIYSVSEIPQAFFYGPG